MNEVWSECCHKLVEFRLAQHSLLLPSRYKRKLLLMNYRELATWTTACFGIAVIVSGLYRFFMEPDGATGLWFGLVMGGVALVAAQLQRTRFSTVGIGMGFAVALLVGGWFCFEVFGKGEHAIRRYLIILAALVDLSFVAAYLLGRPRKDD